MIYLSTVTYLFWYFENQFEEERLDCPVPVYGPIMIRGVPVLSGQQRPFAPALTAALVD